MATSAAFLYNNLGPPNSNAVIEGSSSATVDGLGWDQLFDPQPRHRARCNLTSVDLFLDISAVQSVDVACLISTNLDSTAFVRLRTSATDPTCTSSVLYDSTSLSGVTAAAWNGNVIYCFPASVSTRYFRWSIAVTSGTVDIGLAPLGLLFRPARNFSYGNQEGRVDNSPRQRNNDTGAEFTVQRPTSRTKILSFGLLARSDVRTDFDAMDRMIGVGGDMLYIEDSTDTPANCAQNSIWGSYRTSGQPQLATSPFFGIWSRTVQLTERL